MAAPGSGAKGSSTPVTDEQGPVIGLKLKVLQVRATSPFVLSAEPGLVLIQQTAPSSLFLTGHKGTLQSVLLPPVETIALWLVGSFISSAAWFEDWTQGLTRARLMFYHGAVSPTRSFFFVVRQGLVTKLSYPG